MWRSLPDCSATTGCTVMCIVTKLGSFAYHIFFFLSSKFRDCIFFPSWGAIFNIPECILTIMALLHNSLYYKKAKQLKLYSFLVQRKLYNEIWMCKQIEFFTDKKYSLFSEIEIIWAFLIVYSYLKVIL